MGVPEISLPVRNGQKPLNRADEVDDLLNAVQKLIIPFIRNADDDASVKHTGHGLALEGGGPRTVLLQHHKPEKLVKLLNFQLPENGGGKDALLEMVEKVLKYSVNTWDQGFLDKLYASTNAVGVVAELILAVLNTNLHVYQVSPALSVIEKLTTRRLAALFGFTGPHAGGISTQGGSASNNTALLIARNTLFPDTKINGNGSHNFVLFTSAHGHYSLEKAAQTCGLGSNAVILVPVDASGCMIPSALEQLIEKARADGKTPFFVNATAGTTVFGSFDPFSAISAICTRHKLWLHIDGAWGGSVIFSPKLRHKLAGSHLADSISTNPHKMLGAPVTCSILLGRNMRDFHRANTLPAGYLFHSADESVEKVEGVDGCGTDGHEGGEDGDREVWDLADLTPQCGRRGDSLKLALGWIYYGSTGYAKLIERAFEVAAYFATEVQKRGDFVLVSENPPPCLQVCFYWAPGGKLGAEKENTKTTAGIVNRLLAKGFMIDYAPGDKGSLFRVVVNVQTLKGTVDGLIKAIEECGKDL